MANFGTAQLKHPTPSNFIWGVRIYTAVACAVMGWMPTASFVSHGFQDITTSILGLTTTVANVILPFWGVETSQKNVPIKDVSSMDEEKTS